jgi:phenylpropionate dioxygenase-like ring-hydroxylating dioxygenase large terminal subunit
VDRDLQLALLDRIMAHRAAGDTTDLWPDMHTNPVDAYTNPARYALELERLFRGAPVVACLAADVAGAGAYVTLSITDVPILVVRADDGVVRAFRNVCRHRGACVAEGRGTTAKSFMCPYHGWSYRLDGRLIRPTHGVGFDGLDRAEHGLSEMACDESGGFVFVQLDAPAGSLDATAWLGDLAPELTSFGLAGYTSVETRARTWNMNWKLMLDTFGETYHVRHLHNGSIAPLIRSEPGLHDHFGPHARQVAVRWSISDLDNQPRDAWELLPHTTLSYWFMPNTVMIYQQDHVELFQLFPQGPEHTTAVTMLYSPDPPDTERARRRWQKAMDLLLSVIDTEDFVMCEQIQRSFRSGAQRQLVFGRNEPTLIHYHQTINELLGQEPSEVRVALAGHATAAGG